MVLVNFLYNSTHGIESFLLWINTYQKGINQFLYLSHRIIQFGMVIVHFLYFLQVWLYFIGWIFFAVLCLSAYKCPRNSGFMKLLQLGFEDEDLLVLNVNLLGHDLFLLLVLLLPQVVYLYLLQSLLKHSCQFYRLCLILRLFSCHQMQLARSLIYYKKVFEI